MESLVANQEARRDQQTGAKVANHLQLRIKTTNVHQKRRRTIKTHKADVTILEREKNSEDHDIKWKEGKKEACN